MYPQVDFILTKFTRSTQSNLLNMMRNMLLIRLKTLILIGGQQKISHTKAIKRKMNKKAKIHTRRNLFPVSNQ
jgi:hypothetical protein